MATEKGIEADDHHRPNLNVGHWFTNGGRVGSNQIQLERLKVV